VDKVSSSLVWLSKAFITLLISFLKYSFPSVCCAVERVYVDESIQHDFEQKVVAIAKRWKVGDPKDAETTMGPLVSQVQRDIVSKQVDAAVKEMFHKKDGATKRYQRGLRRSAKVSLQ
jgi:acyl-CoA reductase-like NAD-dependent aldehyde dehydrogenase